jgi:hypothetical protein
VNGGPGSQLSAATVSDLAIDPEDAATIYAATSLGVLVSANGGTTWAGLTNGLYVRSINAIAVDPVDPRRLYAGSSGGGVFTMLLTSQLCGNGTKDGGEACDLGQINGTAGSCCAIDCHFHLAGTLCRAAVGDCDSAERCSGSTAACPSDMLKPSGAPCPADSTAPDVCGGGTMCTHPNTTDACDDGDACTVGEHCQAGSCGSATPRVCAACQTCDHTNGCTGPVCTATPTRTITPTATRTVPVTATNTGAPTATRSATATPTVSTIATATGAASARHLGRRRSHRLATQRHTARSRRRHRRP